MGDLMKQHEATCSPRLPAALSGTGIKGKHSAFALYAPSPSSPSPTGSIAFSWQRDFTRPSSLWMNTAAIAQNWQIYGGIRLNGYPSTSHFIDSQRPNTQKRLNQGLTPFSQDGGRFLHWVLRVPLQGERGSSS
jgi:hypothetical protein